MGAGGLQLLAKASPGVHTEPSLPGFILFFLSVIFFSPKTQFPG